MRTAETCVRKVSAELDSEQRLVTYKWIRDRNYNRFLIRNWARPKNGVTHLKCWKEKKKNIWQPAILNT